MECGPLPPVALRWAIRCLQPAPSVRVRVRKLTDRGSMGSDEVPGPGKREPSGKSDQQIFDEQVARAAGKAVVLFGSLGILAALVMSTAALINSSGSNTQTVTVTAAGGG